MTFFRFQTFTKEFIIFIELINFRSRVKIHSKRDPTFVTGWLGMRGGILLGDDGMHGQ